MSQVQTPLPGRRERSGEGSKYFAPGYLKVVNVTQNAEMLKAQAKRRESCEVGPADI